MQSNDTLITDSNRIVVALIGFNIFRPEEKEVEIGPVAFKKREDGREKAKIVGSISPQKKEKKKKARKDHTGSQHMLVQ